MFVFSAWRLHGSAGGRGLERVAAVLRAALRRQSGGAAAEDAGAVHGGPQRARASDRPVGSGGRGPPHGASGNDSAGAERRGDEARRGEAELSGDPGEPPESEPLLSGVGVRRADAGRHLPARLLSGHGRDADRAVPDVAARPSRRKRCWRVGGGCAGRRCRRATSSTKSAAINTAVPRQNPIRRHSAFDWESIRGSRRRYTRTSASFGRRKALRSRWGSAFWRVRAHRSRDERATEHQNCPGPQAASRQT